MSYYLGIDLGGTNIVAGVVDENYCLLNKSRTPTEAARTFEQVVQSMADTARHALKDCGITEDDVAYIGLGVPSTINPDNRHVVFANNLGWKDVDIEAEFRKNWDIPVMIANDADCAALGEALAGAAKDYKSALTITLGTGVGSGFVINGKLFLGGNGYGVELGHNTLIYNGIQCTCGRVGCIEAYASVTALIRQTIDMMSIYQHSLMWDECERNLNLVNGRTAFNAAKKGDEAGKKVADAYIGYVGAGLSSLVTSLRPHAVLVGGGVSNEGEYLIAPLREIVANTMYGRGIMEPPAVLRAQLGNDAGIIGAALLGGQDL